MDLKVTALQNLSKISDARAESGDVTRRGATAVFLFAYIFTKRCQQKPIRSLAWLHLHEGYLLTRLYSSLLIYGESERILKACLTTTQNILQTDLYCKQQIAKNFYL